MLTEHGQQGAGEEGLHIWRQGRKELDVQAATGWRDCFQLLLHRQPVMS